MSELEMYKTHVIEQAVTLLNGGDDVRWMLKTPKLMESLAEELENRGTNIRETGITGIFAGGTEFTPQYTRFAMEELLGDGIYMTPTYGNTLMGLACSKPVTAEEGYKISYYAPQPRAVIEVVSFDDYDKVVPYGKTGRGRLTTLTRETLVPGFLERGEGEREPPYEEYPWVGGGGGGGEDGWCGAAKVGQEGSGGEHVQGQYEEEPFRVVEHGPDPGRPDAWAAARGADAGLRRRGAWRGGQLSVAIACAGAG